MGKKWIDVVEEVREMGEIKIERIHEEGEFYERSITCAFSLQGCESVGVYLLKSQVTWGTNLFPEENRKKQDLFQAKTVAKAIRHAFNFFDEFCSEISGFMQDPITRDHPRHPDK